jgi:hypothetical protein
MGINLHSGMPFLSVLRKNMVPFSSRLSENGILLSFKKSSTRFQRKKPASKYFQNFKAN